MLSSHLIALLLGATIGVPLPNHAWTVNSSGKSCMRVGSELREELERWRPDPQNSAAEEGIFGRTNPANPRQLVLVFNSRKTCERILWAMQQPPEHAKLDADRLQNWIYELIAERPKLRPVWLTMKKKDRAQLIDEAVKLSRRPKGADALREQAQAYAKKVETAERDRTSAKRSLDRLRLRLALWRYLLQRLYPREAPGSVLEEGAADELPKD